MSEIQDSAEAAPEMGISHREVLDFDSAAAFLGVSTKTFAKVLKAEDLPGRKVGREWKFSKTALLHWLATGKTRDYQDDEDGESGDEITKKRAAASRTNTTANITVNAHARPQATIPGAATIPGTAGKSAHASDSFSADED
ncbi:MAG: helix-turn-helix domain-containing protein [Planctomycetota bacterium]